MAEPQRRLQLVGPAQPAASRSWRVGCGLLLSLVIGHPALGAAMGGDEPFEVWIGRFLLTVLCCVGAVLVLGALYDRFTRPDAEHLTGAPLDGAASSPTPKDSP